MILEVCIDSVESAIAAQEGGAQRVELCSDLFSGGTTPSTGMIQSVRESISIALHVMIRPRAGEFCYSDAEIEVMRCDIAAAKKLGVDGVVFGILTPEGAVDAERTASLLKVARPLSVTFHRAIDECPDIGRAFDEIDRLGIDRVLTSGGKSDVLAGADVIRDLVTRSRGNTKLLAGGGLSFDNVIEVVARSGVREVHALSALSLDHRADDSSTFPAPYHHAVDAVKVRKMITLLSQLPS